MKKENNEKKIHDAGCTQMPRTRTKRRGIERKDEGSLEKGEKQRGASLYTYTHED